MYLAQSDLITSFMRVKCYSFEFVKIIFDIIHIMKNFLREKVCIIIMSSTMRGRTLFIATITNFLCAEVLILHDSVPCS